MRILTKPEVLSFVKERRELFDIAETQNPFAGSAWVTHFLEKVTDEKWTFFIFESAGVNTSLTMLCTRDQTGSRLSSVCNYYVSLYSPLICSRMSASARATEIRALVSQLAKSRPRYSVVNLAPLDGESQDTAAFLRSFAENRWYTRQYDTFGNWYLPCANLTFDEYMSARDSKLLNTWNRKKKKFNGTGSHEYRLEIVSDPSRVDNSMDAYNRVYAKSWKQPEPYPDFVRSWAAICAERGWLRLGLAWAGDVPIAAQLWFTMHRHAYIFKLAYDEAYSKLSAGTVLSAHMFQHALDSDHVVEIDYLTGDDAYKQSWVTERRQRIGLMCCNPRTFTGLARAGYELIGHKIQRWRRR